MARADRGKPSGKFAESKTEPGRKGDYKRGGWPEEAPTQRAEHGAGKMDQARDGETRGRNRKAGSPV